MCDTIERPKTYEEGLRDGFLKGQEEANKVIEQMLQAGSNILHVYAESDTWIEEMEDAMTEEEYKCMDSKMDKATELRKDMYDTQNRLEWFEHEIMSNIEKDGYFIINTKSGYGCVHVPYNESTKHVLDATHDVLVKEAEKAKKEWEEYKV